MSSQHAVLITFGDTLPPRQDLMLRALRGQGWQTTVITWDREGKGRASGNSDGDRQWLAVRLRASSLGSPKLLFKLPRYYYRLLQLIARLEAPDLFILTHFFHLPLVFLLPGRKIYDSIEMYALGLSYHFGPFSRFMLPVLETMEGLMTQKTAGVTVIDSKDGWLEKHFRRWNQHVQVIWNVPAKDDDPAPEAIRSLTEQYQLRKVIACIGGLAKDQGLSVVLQAAAQVTARHPDAWFLFVGEMKDDWQEINHTIKSYGLENNIQFVGWVSYKTLLAHLQHARMGLAAHQPEHFYPFIAAANSRKTFTYMQAGIPMIGPNFGGAGILCDRERCGILVDTTDAAEIARAIIYLLDHPGVARDLGTNGRQAFLEKYNWENEEQKFLQFLQQAQTAAEHRQR